MEPRPQRRGNLHYHAKYARFQQEEGEVSWTLSNARKLKLMTGHRETIDMSGRRLQIPSTLDGHMTTM
jgi:hypothetical protein